MFKTELKCDLCGKKIADYAYEKNYLKLPRYIEIYNKTILKTQCLDVCDKCAHQIANALSEIYNEGEAYDE